jgi:ribose transport system permease protein
MSDLPAESPLARVRRRLLGGALGPFLALAAVVLFFVLAEFLQAAWQWRAEGSGSFGEFLAAYDGKFWSELNARTVLVQTSTVAVAALGMTLVIIAGGIDLSAGTALALSATVLAWCLREGLPVPVALAAGVATGGLCGLVNGTLVSALKVVPFIVTLGTMTFYLGVAKWVADETTVRPALAQVPGWVPEMVKPRPADPPWLAPVLGWADGVGPPADWVRWLILPSGIWLALVLAGGLAAVLRYTVFGRHVFALGSNESTARLCGISVPGTKIAVYTLSGLFVGVAGLYQFARLSAGNPTSGVGLELQIIAAVVIGGGSLSGGRGSVLGTLAGAGIMAVIRSGCTLLGLENQVQDMILGVIIVAAVTLDQFRQRRLAA